MTRSTGNVRRSVGECPNCIRTASVIEGRRRASNRRRDHKAEGIAKSLRTKGEVMNVIALRRVSWEDGHESAVRLWNQARETGEDFVYQLNRKVRRYPWKAVAVALVAGMIVGCVVSLKPKGKITYFS